jgi:hypothetical protein
MSQEDLGATVLDTGPNSIVPGKEGPPTLETLETTQAEASTRGTQLFSPNMPGPDASSRERPPSSRRALEKGSVLEGRYRLERLVGAGAMGEVWAAHHLGLDTPVAIKVIANDVEKKSTGLDRFYREARTMARLSHPNVVRVLDVSLPDSQLPFIAMELLEGESLRDRMKRGADFTLDAACEILGEILGGLGVAHRNGIVHRDLKPANIFLVEDGGAPLGFRVKVLDFGTAILLDSTEERLTQAGIIIGTPYYMAPEQAMGKAPTPACDLYAASVIFYELLSGHVPHEVDDFRALLTRRSTQEAEPIRKWRPKLPGPYHPFFSRALALDAANRYPSAVAMRMALAELPGADGKIANFDDRAFHAALEGALVDASTATGATPVRRTPPSEGAAPQTSHAQLDAAIAAPPQLFGGDHDDPDIVPDDEALPLGPSGLSLNLDDVADGDLKRGLEARERERLKAEGELDEEEEARPDKSGSATKHLLTLLVSMAAAYGVWVVSGGDPSMKVFASTPAMLAALVGAITFVGASVAFAPVAKPGADSPENPE